MSGYELRINVYNTSKFGHANVSFYEAGDHVYTIGANIRMDVIQLALPRLLPFEVDDGIYRDETASHEQALLEGSVISRPLPVSEVTWRDLLDRAASLENQTFNYSLFTEACTDFVTEFYEASGHPGAFGDLFAPDEFTGSWVWMRVPVTMATTDTAVPAYAPTSPPDTALTDLGTVGGPSERIILDLSVLEGLGSPFRDPSVELSFDHLAPHARDANAQQVPSPIHGIPAAASLTFGDLQGTAYSEVWTSDEFVFGTRASDPLFANPPDAAPAIEDVRASFSDPPSQADADWPFPEPGPDQRSEGSHAARVAPSSTAQGRDSDDGGDDLPASSYSAQPSSSRAPVASEHELSFGPSLDRAAPETFDFSPGVDLSFGAPDSDAVSLADIPASSGTFDLGAPVTMEEPQEVSLLDDFWPF